MLNKIFDLFDYVILIAKNNLIVIQYQKTLLVSSIISWHD